MLASLAIGRRAVNTFHDPGPDVARSFFSALLAADGPDPACVEHIIQFGGDWLQAQGVAPYVFYRLQHAGLIGRLPQRARVVLRSAYYASAARNVVLASELGELVTEFRSNKIEPVVLKGMALGATLYPSLAARPTWDVDLLAKRDQIETIRQILVSRGYRDKGLDQEHHQAFASHLHVWRESPGRQPLAVEAHWHLMHDPGYVARVGMTDFLARARPADFGGYSALVLDPVDQLIHACAHLLLHHTMEWHLLWLLDLRLLVDRYGEGWDWAQVVGRAADLGLAGSLKYCLELTETWYGPFLPSQCVEAWQRVRPQASEARYLRIAQAKSARVWELSWQNVIGATTLRQKLIFVLEAFFPPWAYMQYRYGARTRWLAPAYYGWRLMRAMRVAFRRVGDPI